MDDLRFVLTEECPLASDSNANRSVWDAYDRWIRVNDKAQVYILASISDVLSKKNEDMMTKEIMDSLPSVRHDVIKYIYNSCMKEGTFVREHVLDMMVHFYLSKVNGAIIDEKSQFSFILESLLKSFYHSALMR